MLSVVIRRPGRAPFRAVSLDVLTAFITADRKRRMATREELKALRLKAMGVVGGSRQATADMYERIIEYGGKVAEAREAAETAHMGDLNEQLGDLKEDLEELGEFAQVIPPKGAGATAAPAKPTTTPAAASEALAALNAASPPALGKDAWAKGDAYEGTHGEAAKT